MNKKKINDGLYELLVFLGELQYNLKINKKHHLPNVVSVNYVIERLRDIYKELKEML